MERIPKVFFTVETVKDSEAFASVPDGYRMALPEEVALCYKIDPVFRMALNEMSANAVWVDKIGWDSEGPHKISENGEFEKITESEYWDLKAKDKSWHSPGKTHVLLIGGGWSGHLSVVACVLPDAPAHVAYVALGEGMQNPDNYYTVAELKTLAR